MIPKRGPESGLSALLSQPTVESAPQTMAWLERNSGEETGRQHSSVV